MNAEQKLKILNDLMADKLYNEYEREYLTIGHTVVDENCVKAYFETEEEYCPFEVIAVRFLKGGGKWHVSVDYKAWSHLELVKYLISNQ